jgi:hypothetical protein
MTDNMLFGCSVSEEIYQQAVDAAAMACLTDMLKTPLYDLSVADVKQLAAAGVFGKVQGWYDIPDVGKLYQLVGCYCRSPRKYAEFDAVVMQHMESCQYCRYNVSRTQPLEVFVPSQKKLEELKLAWKLDEIRIVVL